MLDKVEIDRLLEALMALRRALHDDTRPWTLLLMEGPGPEEWDEGLEHFWTQFDYHRSPDTQAAQLSVTVQVFSPWHSYHIPFAAREVPDDQLVLLHLDLSYGLAQMPNAVLYPMSDTAVLPQATAHSNPTEEVETAGQTHPAAPVERKTQDAAHARKATDWPTPTIEEPDAETLEELWLTGSCVATDGCLVEPDGVCPHHHPSWLLHLGYI